MQLRTFFSILLLLAGFAGYAQQLRVVQPRIENLHNPIGLDVIQPRFGWLLSADRRNVLHTAYKVRVASNANEVTSGKKLLWSSGKIQSHASVWVPYNGPALQSDASVWVPYNDPALQSNFGLLGFILLD